MAQDEHSGPSSDLEDEKFARKDTGDTSSTSSGNADPLSLVPAGEQYNALRATLKQVKKLWPEVYENIRKNKKVPGMIADIDSGKRSADDVRDNIFEFSVGVDRMVETLGINENTARDIILGKNDGGQNLTDILQLPKVRQKLDLPPPEQGEGSGPEGPGGVLKGGRTILVEENGQERYYQIYEFPRGSGQYISYAYNSREQAEAALGPNFEFTKQSDAWFDQNILVESQAEEVIGQTGTFQGMMEEIMEDAAKAAGIHDPGMAGRIANNAEMQEIMAQALVGEWTQEQILAAQRNTDFWKNELYPGIENLYGSTTNPEQAYREYVGSIVPALKALGYTPGDDGRYSAEIKRMLDGKIDADTFLSQVPIFIQATQNAEFAAVLTEWYDAGDISFDDWFALMEGKGQPELNAIAERAQLDWLAQNAGSQISKDQIEDLADRTQMSQAEAAQLFSSLNLQILATGDEALARYGIDRDDLLSAGANIQGKSGKSPDEVKLIASKIAREQSLFDDAKIGFYQGYKADGTPTKPGLASLNPEGA